MNLRPWTPDDTERLLSWISADPEMLMDIGFTTTSALVRFITQALEAPNSVILAAEDEDETIGYLAAINVMPDGSAQVHIGLSPEHRGRGKELMKEGINAAFYELGLHNLIAMVPNTRRGRAIERFDKSMGFIEPDAKVLYLTREAWEGANGNGR